MKIGYIRVSSITQNTARQLEGETLDCVYTEKVSGKNIDSRPQLKAMMKAVKNGDTVFVHSLDRLARNIKDLLSIVDELNHKGVTVVFKKENMTIEPVDENTRMPRSSSASMSRLLLSIFGAFAQFEREVIKERQLEGITIAKKQGKFKGRAKVDPSKIERAKVLISKGLNVIESAKVVGVSQATLYNYLRLGNTHHAQQR